MYKQLYIIRNCEDSSDFYVSSRSQWLLKYNKFSALFQWYFQMSPATIEIYIQHFIFLFLRKYKNPEVPLLLMVINYKVDPSKVSIPSSVHCGITMNKRWLYSLYICLSKELSISGSGSLYIINLRSASARTAFSLQQTRLSRYHHISPREQQIKEQTTT